MIGFHNWIEKKLISVIIRRTAAIVTAQAKKTRKDIEELKKELLEEIKQSKREG